MYTMQPTEFDKGSYDEVQLKKHDQRFTLLIDYIDSGTFESWFPALVVPMPAPIPTFVWQLRLLPKGYQAGILKIRHEHEA
jgi:hypothetical protein